MCTEVKMPPKHNRSRKTKDIKENDTQKSHIIAFIFLAAALFLFVCLIFTEQTGYLGAIMSYAFRSLLGDAAPFFPLFLLIISVGYFWSSPIENVRKRLIGLLIIFVIMLYSFHLAVYW